MWCFFRKEVTDMTKRWQDGVNMLLGLWLFISPWVMQYADAQAAACNAYGMGTAIVVFAADGGFLPPVLGVVLNTPLALLVVHASLALWCVVPPYGRVHTR